jgi:penicillin-binding protein 2
MEVQPNTTILMKRALNIYLGIVIAIFVVLILRLAWLQIIETQIYQNRAVTNATRLIYEDASRGEIVDRNNEVLVTNRPVFNISLNYLDLKNQDTDQVIRTLVEIINDPEITFESVKELFKGKTRLFEPIVIKRDVSIELVTAIEERRRDLPGVSIDVHPQRSYPYGFLAGHLLGYVHSIKEELEQPGFEDYGINDLVGKTGVEKYYESYLRGQKGYSQVEVNSQNRPVRKVRSVPSVQGDKLVLTLDLKLQQAMEKAFDETLARLQEKYPKAKAGGAVLLEVKTGKVLAMASRPGLNPEDFNGKSLSQAQADYYFNNEPPALRNRVIQGSYVPGSTFKPVVGLSVLSAAQATPQDTVTCTGRYWYPPYIKCIGVHGRVNYYTAMAKSCNVYFQEMGRRAGIAQIGKVGRELGLGEKTGIDLPYESSGLLPHIEWQEQEFGKRREKINNDIDAKIEKLEKEYKEKIAAADAQSKKELERELKGKKNLLEQQRRERLQAETQWHDYDTFNTSIGQGYNQYTIIQLVNYVATIANDGKRYKPYVVDQIIDNEGILVEQFAPELVMEMTVPPDVITETQKAMRAVASPLFIFPFLFQPAPELYAPQLLLLRRQPEPYLLVGRSFSAIPQTGGPPAIAAALSVTVLLQKQDCNRL